MKKFLHVVFFMAGSFCLIAQNSFSDDFEQYTAGSYIAASSNTWKTWSGTKGGTDDNKVSNERAHSGVNSLKFLSTSASGGPADIILPFGGRRTSGTFTLEMWMYVVSNKGAYFNFQGNAVVGQIWSLDAFFDPNGAVRFTLGTGGSSSVATGQHPKDNWFKLKIVANLTDNNWEAFIDNKSIGSWSNPNNAVASMDIYPVSSNNQAEYFIDDVSYNFEAFVAPNLDASLTQATVRQKGLAGTSSSASIKIKNVGRTKVTSAEVEWSINGGAKVTENYSLSLDSLKESAALPLSKEVSYTPGVSTLNVNITKINGLTDDKAANNSKTVSLEGVNPAPGKKIVVEEATGTWCQWCPRGAVYLDSLTRLFPDHFIGIAVHNRDPMTVTAYDAGLTTFPGFTGFPSVITNRRTLSDPSAIEPIFYDQIVELTPVLLDCGAAFDPNSRMLRMEAKATFTESVSGDYRFNLVVVEDEVKGTASGYNQSNAYAGGSNGVMGGFELLPNPVPAARMVYNHVGRAIMDGWAGEAGYLPSDIPANTSYIKSYDWIIPTTSNLSKLKLVVMMLDPNGEIINASEISFDEAVAKGLFTASENPVAVTGEVVVSPNPSSDMAQVHFTLKEEKAIGMEILDMMGRTMAKRTYGTWNGSVDLPVQTSSLENGNYLIKVSVGQEILVKKLTVVH